jgi:hypothetical protein
MISEEGDQFQYRNVLVQDKEELKQLSCKLTMMYKESVKKFPKLVHLNSKSSAPKFDLENILKYYQAQEPCAVRNMA